LSKDTREQYKLPQDKTVSLLDFANAKLAALQRKLDEFPEDKEQLDKVKLKTSIDFTISCIYQLKYPPKVKVSPPSSSHSTASFSNSETPKNSTQS
jgi:hypothetical protein